MTSIKFRIDAVLALQEAAEAYVVGTNCTRGRFLFQSNDG